MTHSEKVENLLYPWNKSLTSKEFLLVDDTLRDGLQAPHVTAPNFMGKLQLLEQMEKNHVDVCIAAFPASSPKAMTQAKGMIEYVEKQGYQLSLAFAGRTSLEDLEPMVTLQQHSRKRLTAYAFVGCSPIRQYIECWDIAFIESSIIESIAYLKANNLKPIAVFEDATRSRPEDLRRFILSGLDAGAEGICLADTVGYVDPSGVEALLSFAKDLTGEGIDLEWHGHNDRGLAVANALTALSCGANALHATSLGIGERAGNLCLEQLLINLYLAGDERWDISHLCEFAELTSQLAHVPIPAALPGIGQAVFTTGTGVHASAVYKAIKSSELDLADMVYSSVPARKLGRRQNIEVGPMSGRANVMAKCATMGLECNEDQVLAVLDVAKQGNRILQEDEILTILNF